MAKPGMRPGMGGMKGSNKPAMTRIKTVWITKQTEPFNVDYQVGKQIGEPGQFGKAFRCKRRKDKKIFAVKCISKARFYRLDRSASRRQALLVAMQGEIDIMRRLKHEYIVNMESVYEDKHTLYIVMEECKGGELFDRIRAKQRYKEIEAIPIIKMMLDALFYMHEYNRVVHCDLKPDNILFVNNKEDSPIKIIDFGMSKVLPRLNHLRELCGTPYYTAPEIIKGSYAHLADMWSVGVIMFVMLFGFPPFYVDPSKYYGQKEAAAIYKLIQQGFDPTVKKGYGPWFPKKMPVSENARDLMSKLMQMDQAKRLSAKEALGHPWIKLSKQTINNNDDGNNIEKTTKENNDEKKKKKFSLGFGKKEKEKEKNNKINQDDEKNIVSDDNAVSKEEGLMFANFGNAHKFKFAISALFKDQYEKMRPKHFENLKKLYKKMDTDGNGKIDYDEFKKGMIESPDFDIKEDNIKKMFKELDVHNMGEIDFEALLNAAVHDYLIANDQRLYDAFRELDDDEDGKIKVDELKKKLKDLGQEDMLKSFVDAVDIDKDGTIDYEEFLRAVHPNYNETPKWFWEGSQKPKTPINTN